MDHESLLASRALRTEVAGRTEALDKVKALVLLPDGLHVTTKMVADYFGIGLKTLESLVLDHRDELESNGYQVLAGASLTSFKKVCAVSPRVNSIALFTRRTVLNVAMLLRDSVVARHVRTHLLDRAESTPGRPVDNFIHSLAEWIDTRIEDALTHTGRTDREREAAGTLAALDAMTPAEFEQHIARLCRRDGCEQITVTSGHGDRGADIIGYTPSGRRLVVRCEGRTAATTIGSGDVQKFIGTAGLDHRADAALYVATCPFTREALLLSARHEVTAVHRGLLEAWNNGTRLRALG
ncbi:hypothetical protein SRB5_27740 [Streptomyces sp. RB5]|uniref:Restriction endonuclease type IV Mrr domain-containing protein n=1 Tax=Streptomyces smaragdinus TaxID=2585196 RepID=A0A7K0CGR8_9ACTN|nr:restriction endonuclease [Streptomyces smaragdinus]MQY12638.1 hypothetical protein [Streptomyces smaragdinus]